MGRITHGPRDTLKKQPAAPRLQMPVIVEQKADKDADVLELPQIIVEKQVVIETKFMDKRSRQHSKLVSLKVDDLGNTLDEVLLEQKRQQSTLQMQLSDANNQIRRLANAAANREIDIVSKLEKLSAELQTVAETKPNVAEIHRVETKRVSKSLVFLNILLLAAVAALLCKK